MLREAVAVGVSRANECSACSYAHHRFALNAGLTPAQLGQLEGLDGEELDEDLWVAVAWARRQAVTGFPAPEADELGAALAARYDLPTRHAVELLARRVSVTNAVGNAVAALSSRARGRPVPGSRALDELAITLLAVSCAPLLAAWTLGRRLAAAGSSRRGR